MYEKGGVHLTEPFVSVIVPVLHDAEQLDDLLSSLPPPADPTTMDIIVVSGVAEDPSLDALHERFPRVRWTSTRAGRGHQMNHGARRARGRWLLFVHADSRLSSGWDEEIRRANENAVFVGGSFRFRLPTDGLLARVIEWGVRMRVRWLGLPFGDQALFARRDVFRAIGGYRSLPLMEDVDFVRQLKRRGRLWSSNLPVHVSPRRWQRDGWVRRSAENIMLLSMFLAGVDPRHLARRYYRGEQAPAPRERP